MKKLATLKLEELLLIKEVLTNDDPQKQLDALIEKRTNQDLHQGEYESSRLPTYYEEYQEQCSYLLSRLGAVDVNFLSSSYTDTAGNKGGGETLDYCGLQKMG